MCFRHTAAVRVDPAAFRPVVRALGNMMTPNMPWYYCVHGPRGISPSGSCTPWYHGVLGWMSYITVFLLGHVFRFCVSCLSVCLPG